MEANQQAAGSKQNSEVGAQKSMERLKPISDFRLLTSGMDDFNDFPVSCKLICTV